MAKQNNMVLWIIIGAIVIMMSCSCFSSVAIGGYFLLKEPEKKTTKAKDASGNDGEDDTGDDTPSVDTTQLKADLTAAVKHVPTTYFAWTGPSGVVAGSGQVPDASGAQLLSWYGTPSSKAWEAYYKFTCIKDSTEGDFSNEVGPVSNGMSTCPGLRVGASGVNPCVEKGATLKVYRRFTASGTYESVIPVARDGSGNFDGKDAYLRDSRLCLEMQKGAEDAAKNATWQGRTDVSGNQTGLTWNATDRSGAWDGYYQFRCIKGPVVSAWSNPVGPVSNGSKWCPSIRTAGATAGKNTCSEYGGTLDIQLKRGTTGQYAQVAPKSATSNTTAYDGTSDVFADIAACPAT